MSSCDIQKTEISNILYTSGEYVVLTNKVPYENVSQFTGVDENFVDSGTGTILKKEFRYSLDGNTYSEFQELNIENLKGIQPTISIYFQFRYILLSGGPVTIISVSLDCIKEPIKNILEDVPNIRNEDKIYAYPIVYKSTFLWEPYKMNRAIRLYKDLNLMVNNMFGHDVHYYRVLPHGRSKDVFLMEYSLYEHSEKVCLKVVVPNNEFPDNKLNMGPFGVDFELPFEVEVDKDYFQKIFGHGSGPQKRDVLFFPIYNRIYEVSSSYLYRNFMNEPLYFKVTLIKWLPKTNVEQSEEVDILETFSASAESLFGTEIEQEKEKISNPKQFNISTTFEDPVRSFIDLEQQINEIKLLNYYTVIAEFSYDMRSQLELPIFSLSLDTKFEKDKTYYVRYPVNIEKPDIQYYYSVKKLKYIGISKDNKKIFKYKKGFSQIQSEFSIYQIFNKESEFNIYDVEYDINSNNLPICDCKIDAFSYRKRVIEYKAINEFPRTEDRSFSAWFKIKPNESQKFKVLDFEYDMYSNSILININKPVKFLIGDQITLKRSTESKFCLYGIITKINSNTQIIIEAEKDILDFVKVSFPTWENYRDFVLQKSYSNILLNGHHNNKGFKIEILENRHVKIYDNSETLYFSLSNTRDGLLDDTWYAIFINFSNIFKQLTVNIWGLQWNEETGIPATTDLSIIMNKTVPFKQLDRSSCINFYMEPSNTEITNIRLYNKVIETDKQTFVLNQNIVKDAQWSIIIDNCIPQSRLPYIGYTR